jgi:hypothetical protein
MRSYANTRIRGFPLKFPTCTRASPSLTPTPRLGPRQDYGEQTSGPVLPAKNGMQKPTLTTSAIWEQRVPVHRSKEF